MPSELADEPRVAARKRKHFIEQRLAPRSGRKLGEHKRVRITPRKTLELNRAAQLIPDHQLKRPTDLASAHDLRILQREMTNRWPFFAMLCSTLEMSLFKSDLAIADRYLELLGDDPARELWEPIRAEHERVVRTMLEISGTNALLQSTPALMTRLSHRNPWTDPLSYIQIDLLRRTRAGDGDAERPLLLTINGIAAGMRNTG